MAARSRRQLQPFTTFGCDRLIEFDVIWCMDLKWGRLLKKYSSHFTTGMCGMWHVPGPQMWPASVQLASPLTTHCNPISIHFMSFERKKENHNFKIVKVWSCTERPKSNLSHLPAQRLILPPVAEQFPIIDAVDFCQTAPHGENRAKGKPRLQRFLATTSSETHLFDALSVWPTWVQEVVTSSKLLATIVMQSKVTFWLKCWLCKHDYIFIMTYQVYHIWIYICQVRSQHHHENLHASVQTDNYILYSRCLKPQSYHVQNIPK